GATRRLPSSAGAFRPYTIRSTPAWTAAPVQSTQGSRFVTSAVPRRLRADRARAARRTACADRSPPRTTSSPPRGDRPVGPDQHPPGGDVALRPGARGRGERLAHEFFRAPARPAGRAGRADLEGGVEVGEQVAGVAPYGPGPGASLPPVRTPRQDAPS